MIRTTLALAAATLLTACSASSETELDIPEVAMGDVSEDTLRDVVRELSSDEFAGRMPGTIGEEKTVALLIDRFEKAGLQPGNNGSWTQDVPIVTIEGTNLSSLRVGGPAAYLEFEPRKDFVALSYREVPEIEIEDSEMVFVGFGINAPERGWNDYEGVDMTGKTAVILVNDPDYETDGLEGEFNGRAMTYYGRWSYKYEEAARQGAAAALIVHDEFPAAYGWNVVEGGWTGPQGYAQRENKGMDQTLANGWVQKGVAEAILTAAGHDLTELTAAAKQKGFKAVPLGVAASLSFENSFETLTTQNVIGVLPGSERPDEYIIHTAHWDHLGTCPPDDEGDDICNGAIDNATGTAALVALAEAHSKAGAPDRSLVFLAVTAEEQGLLGADHYAANPVFPLAQTVGGLNMDALLMGGPAKDVTVVGAGKSELDAFLDAALSMTNLVGTPEPTPEKGFYYRSDHFAFAKRGVPMLYIDPGLDLVDGGTEAGLKVQDAYYAGPYHSPNDEYDENRDWSGIMGLMDTFYLLGRSLGNSTSWPNWVEGDEFRATRDEDCAASEAGC